MDQESKRKATTSGKIGRAAFYLVPILVFCTLWLPVFWAYYVPGIKVSGEMLQQARKSPPDSTLAELRDFSFLPIHWKDKRQLIDAASGLLRGNIRMEGCYTQITMPFSAHDLDKVPPSCDLLFAAFSVPEVLLEAYEASGRDEFFTAAESVITNVQAYEQGALLPRGELWNDHAVAARICVLANFWRLYRHSPGYRPEVAAQVLQMVARAEQLLAKPGQFTFSTNHGIVQNLALWHAALAFPSLPRTEEYRRLAHARLNDQMKFYVGHEGVVLEHSASYHLFGLTLLGMAFRYLDLMHEPVPPDWIDKYDRAKQFYGTLRRPDGSLPVFGDTDDEADPLGPLVTTFDQEGRPRLLAHQSDWKPPEAIRVYPVAGYSIWWDGLEFWPNPQNLSQTVVAWSYFPGQAHKHADEMSVLFWAGGQNWLSNIGYWPYESQWRNAVESWAGSDAPHLVGENPGAARTTKLLSSGSTDHLAALDLERTGVYNYVARRQVIHSKPNVWLVLDNTIGSDKSRTTTTWTAAPDVIWQNGPMPGSVRLEGPHARDRVDMFFLGSQGTERRLVRGSYSPFAGWQLESGVPVPAPALLVEQPVNNSWMATIWIWEKAGSREIVNASPRMTRWVNATDWEIEAPTRSGNLSLRRQGNRLRVHSGDGADDTLELGVGADVSSEYVRLRDDFMTAASRYPVFSANIMKRKKITYLLLGIFLLQQLFFAGYKLFDWPGIEILRSLNTVAWILGAIWLVGFYL